MGRGTYYVRNPSRLSPPMYRLCFLVSGRVYVKDVCYIMGGLNARPNGASPTSVAATEVTQYVDLESG